MRLSENYEIRKLLGRNVAVPKGTDVIKSDQLVELNESAAFILETLADEMEYEPLLQALAVKYEADAADLPCLKDDLDAFLQMATEAKLIVGAK